MDSYLICKKKIYRRAWIRERGPKPHRFSFVCLHSTVDPDPDELKNFGLYPDLYETNADLKHALQLNFRLFLLLSVAFLG
jgi:hypothetical protein